MGPALYSPGGCELLLDGEALAVDGGTSCVWPLDATVPGS